jgi:hypothetical protein
MECVVDQCDVYWATCIYYLMKQSCSVHSVSLLRPETESFVRRKATSSQLGLRRGSNTRISIPFVVKASAQPIGKPLTSFVTEFCRQVFEFCDGT